MRKYGLCFVFGGKISSKRQYAVMGNSHESLRKPAVVTSQALCLVKDEQGAVG